MNYFFEYTYILILVCLRQKLSPKNVSNSSQIIPESFVGAFSVHFNTLLNEYFLNEYSGLFF